MKLTVIIGVVCFVVGLLVGAVLYAMVAVKRLDEYKWKTEENIQDIIHKYSDRIFALQDIIELVKLKVKAGELVGVPNHQLMLLNGWINNSAKEWEKEHLKEEKTEDLS